MIKIKELKNGKLFTLTPNSGQVFRKVCKLRKTELCQITGAINLSCEYLTIHFERIVYPYPQK